MGTTWLLIDPWSIGAHVALGTIQGTISSSATMYAVNVLCLRLGFRDGVALILRRGCVWKDEEADGYPSGVL